MKWLEAGGDLRAS